MANLKDETLEILESNGYSKSDVDWIGCVDFAIPTELFWELADRCYDNGFGGQEVAKDLIVVLKDGSWLERYEYDGSEWWELKVAPRKPELTVENAFAVMSVQASGDCCCWEKLSVMNEPVMPILIGGDS